MCVWAHVSVSVLSVVLWSIPLNVEDGEVLSISHHWVHWERFEGNNILNTVWCCCCFFTLDLLLCFSPLKWSSAKPRSPIVWSQSQLVIFWKHQHTASTFESRGLCTCQYSYICGIDWTLSTRVYLLHQSATFCSQQWRVSAVTVHLTVCWRQSAVYIVRPVWAFLFTSIFKGGL